MKRREFGKGLLGAAGLSAFPNAVAKPSSAQSQNPFSSPINVIIPARYALPEVNKSSNYAFRLTRATLDFLEASYAGQTVPIWYRKFEEIDFEKRVSNITYWIMQGAQRYQTIHPVDPAWIMAQIMHESYFYEFAVSGSLAVGICQFVSRTAHEFEMLCAGDKAEHKSAGYKMAELADEESRYFSLIRQKRNFTRTNQMRDDFNFENLVEAIAAGGAQSWQADAEKYLANKARLEAFDEDIRQARDGYTQFIRANLEGRDIFNEADLDFLLQFDERVTYKKPIFGMIQMLARSLRARNGYIIAAAAGYNAGLSTTLAEGLFRPYGKIPNFEETVTYLSRVFVLHHEISKRI